MIICKADIKTVTVTTGTPTITVSGIEDRDGNVFTPKTILILGASVINTIEYGDGGFADAFNIATGFDSATSTRRGEVSSDAAGFGFKVVDGGSSGDYSVIYMHAQLSFGGSIKVEAYISAVRSGEADVKFDFIETGWPGYVASRSFILVFFGGDDLSTTVGTPSGTGLPTILGYEPVGIINKFQTVSSSTATGTGGGGAGAIGFKTIDSGQALSACFDVLQGGVGRVQVTDKCVGNLNSSLTLDSGTMAIDATGFTLTGSLLSAYLAFGGTNLKAYCAAQTQPISTGNQTIDTNLTNEVVIFVGVGAPSSASVRTDKCEICIGVTDGVTQACIWAAEVGNNPSNPLGARSTRTDSLFKLGTPNRASSAFTDSATFVSNDTGTGVITIHWGTVSGAANQFIVFALGPEANPTPPAETGQMYKLVPGKTNDTVWLTGGATEDRAIPDPTFATGLVGDEDSDA